ncbi:putative endo-1,3(4)-beta-glucanase 2 [Smittium mucronatum]|uniref:glucan endo-1,3-beta-D-glucosidase n=1 Tax=Smittium mucronatum TaxID=133383 RepID=A0A1R0GXK4_9FUNG|nr:putative endo-1,3(4)-beta-glucanase 2 [Smittium mucronatum]
METPEICETLPYQYAPNNNLPTQFWGKIARPYPTNKWWLNLVMTNGESPIYPYPYSVAAKIAGLSLWHPDKIEVPNRVYLNYKNEWLLGSTTSFTDRRLVAYDELTATYMWSVNPDAPESGGYMKVPFVKGSPFISLYYYNLQCLFKFTSITFSSLQKVIGNRCYTATLTDGSRWAIFFSTDCNLTLDNPQQITSTAPFTGYVRFSFIPTNLTGDDATRHINTLFTHSPVVPESGSVRFSGNSIIHSYKVNDPTKSDLLLMLTLPHHRQFLQNPKYPSTQILYTTLKGDMVGVTGPEWNLYYQTLSGAGFGESKTIPPDYIAPITDSLKTESIDFTVKDSDNSIYFRGKELARFARLAFIAWQLRDLNKSLYILSNLKTCLEFWFESKGNNKLVYDTTWGGLVTTDGLKDQGADFGNVMYNDHHFHYGYYTYAISTILYLLGLNDGWFAKYKTQIYAFCDEYANNGTSTNFIKYRHMDFYDGNSWANGLYVFENSRNQESTSEAVNAYYGAYLLQLALKDTTKTNIMNLLLTSEIKSSQYYWQIGNPTRSIYPAEFSKNCIVGILWENSAEYVTWFGTNPEYIYGIQMLPFTPISFELLDPEWLSSSWPTIKSRCLTSNPTITDEWKGLILMGGAIVDKTITLNDINALKAYDNGNSRTNAIWWLAMCRK